LKQPKTKEIVAMVDVYLDGSRLEFEDAGNDSTIGDLISAVERDLTCHRRFVMELWVDGHRLPEWREGVVLSKPLSGHSDYKLNTASMEEVALEGLDLLQEYIRLTKDNVPLCAGALRSGGANADAAFASIFEGLVEIVRTADALARSGEKYNMDLFTENPAVFFGPILKSLEDIKDAKDAGDTVLLADLLEYELLPFLDEMEEKLFHFNA